MREDKQMVCDAMCEALKKTSALGDLCGNPLRELKYIPEGNGMYSEIVRPIFADGTGENGFYDINVSMDSGLGVVIDIVDQFVKYM